MLLLLLLDVLILFWLSKQNGIKFEDHESVMHGQFASVNLFEEFHSDKDRWEKKFNPQKESQENLTQSNLLF